MVNKILSLALTVVIVLALIYAFTKKPKVKLAPTGFPLNPKNGDTFVLNGVLYSFDGKVWVVVKTPTNPSERFQGGSLNPNS